MKEEHTRQQLLPFTMEWFLRNLKKHNRKTGMVFEKHKETLKLMCYPQQLGRSWKVFGHLPQNPPEPCLLSAPELSGTSSAICPGTLRNLISNLPRNSPKPHQPSAPEPSGTLQNLLRNLLRNLVLQPHRIAPELFWAKDPIASVAVGENHPPWQINIINETWRKPTNRYSGRTTAN